MTTGLRVGAAAAAALAIAAADGRGGATVGSTVPDLVLHDLSGGTTRIAALRGTPVVLAFWATWCTRCLAELDHLETVRAAYPDARLKILAVSLDEDRPDLDAFLSGHSYPFPVFHDAVGSTAAPFRSAEDLPVTVVIDSAGTIRYLALEFSDGSAAPLDAAISAVVAPPAD